MPASRFGGWNPDALRSTLIQSTGAGSDFDADDETRFVRGVARVIRNRAAVDEYQEDPKALSVFLLSPNPPEPIELLREPMLDAGHTAVAGKVWFVNAAVVTGKAKELSFEDADSIFRFITEQINLGHVPTAVVDPRGNETVVRFYPDGLNSPDDCVPVRMDTTDIDRQQIFDVVERVYRQCLVTPDAQSPGNKLWADSIRFRPKQDAEHRVQAYLKPAFTAAFPTCLVYEEFAGTLGRADLHLEEPDPQNREKSTFLAVLELKVLRSYGETGKTYSETEVKRSVEKGVKQAGLYRKERGHRWATMCCFDMRKQDSGDECFDEEVETLASNLEVDLRRWFLYASSELARDSLALLPKQRQE